MGTLAKPKQSAVISRSDLQQAFEAGGLGKSWLVEKVNSWVAMASDFSEWAQVLDFMMRHVYGSKTPSLNVNFTQNIDSTVKEGMERARELGKVVNGKVIDIGKAG